MRAAARRTRRSGKAPGAIQGARSAALPAVIPPELATLVREPPEGSGWLHEAKFDGYRIIARLQKGALRLLSRNGKDWTRRFASVASDLKQLPAEASRAARGQEASGDPSRRPGRNPRSAAAAIGADAPEAEEKGMTVAGVRLTHPDRILYPEQGVTKRDLAGYYEKAASLMLPYVTDRPLTLVRCPMGRQRQCFFQKHIGGEMGEPIRTVRIREQGGPGSYAAVADAAGLVSLAQMGVLEIHISCARASNFERPDLLVFDLDPDAGITWERVVQAARLVRERLAGFGLEGFVKTTGGKGLHVVSPLRRRNDWNQLRAFARGLAEGITREEPSIYTSVASRSRRKGRIFIDYLRNGRGATFVAPYSTRSRPGAPVSAPLHWEELESVLPDRYNVGNMAERLGSRRRDPWRGFDEARRTITRSALRSLGTD